MTAVVPPAATIRTVPYIGPRPFTRDDVRLGF